MDGIANAARSTLLKAGSFTKAAPTAPITPVMPKPVLSGVGPRMGGGGGAEGPKIPTMHKGGKVKKDGPVNLKAGETVRTKEQEKEMQDKMKKASPEALMTKDEPKEKKPAA